MKIAYASDIHLELNSGPALAALEKNIPDVVVLAGDIGTLASVIVTYAKLLSERLDCHVVFTTGNHEYYDRIPIQIKDKELFDLTKDEDKIHYLQDTHVIIDGVL
ncbi:MAG: metallophosphoesterase, partial [Gammaproteobacteria bacterium]|nr:metallophosphoesterase [Gammaproteobacteria bacterium]